MVLPPDILAVDHPRYLLPVRFAVVHVCLLNLHQGLYQSCRRLDL